MEENKTTAEKIKSFFHEFLMISLERRKKLLLHLSFNRTIIEVW